MFRKKKMKELEARVEHLERIVEGISASSIKNDKVGDRRFDFYSPRITMVNCIDVAYNIYRKTNDQMQYREMIKRERQVSMETGISVEHARHFLKVEEAVQCSDEKVERTVHLVLADRVNFSCEEYIKGNLPEDEWRYHVKKGLEERKGKIIPYITLGKYLTRA